MTIPATVEDDFAIKLKRLRTTREDMQQEGRVKRRPRRRSLSRQEREAVLAKTKSRCHLCGGPVDGDWHADHVLARSGGGPHSVDNYLPAHRLCNQYRWDFSAEEFQLIVKLGVWARTQVERQTAVGCGIATGFLAYERARILRGNARTRARSGAPTNATPATQ